MSDKCYIDKCDNKKRSRGLCKKHLSYALAHNLSLDDREKVNEYILTYHREHRSRQCYICGEPVDSVGLCLRHYAKCSRYNIDVYDRKAVEEFISMKEVRTRKIRRSHGRYRVVDDIYEKKTGKSMTLYSCYDLTVSKIAYNKAMEILYGPDSFTKYETDLEEEEYKRIYDSILLNLKPRGKGIGNQGLKCKSRVTQSRYVGIYIVNEKHRYKYRAHINYKKQRFYLGNFPVTAEGERLAAIAYNEAAVLLYGDKAVLNPVEMPEYSVIDCQKITEKKSIADSR